MFNIIAALNTDKTPLFTVWAGQSNMEGDSTSRVNLPTLYRQVWDGIQVWNNSNSFASLDGTTTAKFGAYFTALVDLHRFTGRTIYAIVYTEGGTSVAERIGVNDWNTNSVGELYDNLKGHITDAKAYLSSSMIDYKDLSVIWYQGESDAAFSSEFYTNTTDFIKGVRTHIGSNLLSWVEVQVDSTYNASNQDGWDEVVQTQKDIANNILEDPDLTNITLVPNDGQYPNHGSSNTIHLNDEGQTLIGQDIAKILYDLI